MTIPIHLKYNGCKTVIHQPEVELAELDPETMSPLQKAVIQGFQYRDMLESGKEFGAQWYCAGAITKKGHPHHPLYLRKDEKLKPFDVSTYLDTL